MICPICYGELKPTEDNPDYFMCYKCIKGWTSEELTKPILERCEKCKSILSAKCPKCGHPLWIYENGEYMVCDNCNTDYFVEV